MHLDTSALGAVHRVALRVFALYARTEAIYARGRQARAQGLEPPEDWAVACDLRCDLLRAMPQVCALVGVDCPHPWDN